MYANSFENKADLRGPAVEGIGLLPLDCWDCGVRISLMALTFVPFVRFVLCR